MRAKLAHDVCFKVLPLVLKFGMLALETAVFVE